MFKLALGGGHRLGTPGKQCLKSLDPDETPEWWLNDRICDRVEALLAAGYDGIEVLRVDDTNGVKPIDLTARIKAANDWGADFALAVHHNAGIKGGKGGGIVAYVCNGVDQTTKAWQKELYDALIAHTGLKGNRADPLATADFDVLVYTKMPAVLLELGFMDSATDVPIILSEEYANQCAAAIVEVVAKRGGLQLKARDYGDYSACFEADVKWAVDNGIIRGDGAGNFGWRDPVTREQAAAMLHRAAEMFPGAASGM